MHHMTAPQLAVHTARTGWLLLNRLAKRRRVLRLLKQLCGRFSHVHGEWRSCVLRQTLECIGHLRQVIAAHLNLIAALGQYRYA